MTDKGSSNAQAAYDDTLRRLRSGEITASDRIVDMAVARALDMSRMPVREALLRLVNEGYLVGTTRGFRLPELSHDDVRDVFEIRRLLEPRAAATAAVERSERHLAAMRDAIADQHAAIRSGDAHAFMAGTMRFRGGWIDAVPNRRLAAMIQRSFDQVNAVRLATLDQPEVQTLSVSLAEALLLAFERGDSLAVYEQMANFIDVAQRTYFTAVTPVPVP